MTYYDDIYEFAVDNHYLITTEDADRLGIPAIELAKLAYRGKLDNIARGLYRLTRYIPSDIDPYAQAVARVGKDAYLYGESVIAMLRLAPTNPEKIYVATTARVRRKLPEAINVVKRKQGDEVTVYDGVRSQRVNEAIVAAKETMMTERLLNALQHAEEEGYMTLAEIKRAKAALL